VDKQRLDPEALMALVHDRLLALPMFQSAMQADPSFVIRIGVPRPHQRDSCGRNWNIEVFETGFAHWPQCHAEFRYIVDRLRNEYDLPG
jgi:hypothetical protein